MHINNNMADAAVEFTHEDKVALVPYVSKASKAALEATIGAAYTTSEGALLPAISGFNLGGTTKAELLSSLGARKWPEAFSNPDAQNKLRQVVNDLAEERRTADTKKHETEYDKKSGGYQLTKQQYVKLKLNKVTVEQAKNIYGITAKAITKADQIYASSPPADLNDRVAFFLDGDSKSMTGYELEKIEFTKNDAGYWRFDDNARKGNGGEVCWALAWLNGVGFDQTRARSINYGAVRKSSTLDSMISAATALESHADLADIIGRNFASEATKQTDDDDHGARWKPTARFNIYIKPLRHFITFCLRFEPQGDRIHCWYDVLDPDASADGLTKYAHEYVMQLDARIKAANEIM